MNRQTLRQEIVADLEQLLQAAKEVKYDEKRGGIGKKTDKSGRTFYMNLNKGRRATTQEWKAVFGEDTSNVERQKSEREAAKSKLAKDSELAKKAGEAISRMDSAQKAVDAIKDPARQAATQKILDMEKRGIKENANLGKLLQDRASYSKEAADVAISQATDALFQGYAGVHDYLSNKDDRQKFNESASKAIGGLVGKAQGAMTTFAQTVMDGIGNKLQEAATNAKSSVDDLMKQPEMIVLSGQMMGAMHAIQSATSPATSAMNQGIANMAFSINMANAQVQFWAARANNAKLGKEGQGIIKANQDALKEVKTPEDLEALKEKFNKEIEDYKNRLEGERLANEVRKNEQASKEIREEQIADEANRKEQFARNRINAINNDKSGVNTNVPGKNLGSNMKSQGSAPIPSNMKYKENQTRTTKF